LQGPWENISRYHNINPLCFRALGQGAFGEVYQGYFKKSSTDSMEMPVAVKTLPELSTNQGKMFFYSYPIKDTQ